MKSIQFISTSPTALVNLLDEAIKRQLDELKKNFQPKEQPIYMTRLEVAEMLHVDISTVHNLSVRGVLKKKQIGGRVLYLREEVQKEIIDLK